MIKTIGTLGAIAILMVAMAPLTADAQQRQQPAARSAPAARAAPAMRAAPRPAVRAARPRAAPRHAVVPPRVQAQRAAQAQRLREQRALRALPPRQRAARRDARPRLTTQAARQGRFAVQDRPRLRRIDRARLAWRYGRLAYFVPWYGPVFWPYAYSDIFDYTFWPGGYYPGFWFFAYDDFFDGVFWGEAGPPIYAYAAPRAARPRYAAVQELCSQPGSGITAWPFADIERKVGLNADQKQSLGEVRDAAEKAAAAFKASCPQENAFPLTPTGRLDSMTARLGATLEAVRTVRPALEKFYAALSDEQKERFNEIGPAKSPKSAASPQARAALPDDAKQCAQAKPGLTNLPIERIGEAVAPSQAQQAELDKLGEATVKAVGILQAACPSETPLTPPGRLEAMEKRLQAMVEAANTVKPALEGFYGSLTGEQKARFNRMGRELAQAQ